MNLNKIIENANDDNYIGVNEIVQSELKERFINRMKQIQGNYFGNTNEQLKEQCIDLMEEKAGHYDDDKKKILIQLMEDTEFDSIDEFEMILDEKINSMED